jgi:hypothetical protein
MGVKETAPARGACGAVALEVASRGNRTNSRAKPRGCRPSRLKTGTDYPQKTAAAAGRCDGQGWRKNARARKTGGPTRQGYNFPCTFRASGGPQNSFSAMAGEGLAARAKAHQPRSWSRGGASDKDGRSISGGFHQLKPLRSLRPKDGPRFAIGRRLCQLQAMGGEGDILLAFFDRLVCHLPRSRYHDRDAGLFNNL